MKSALRVPLVKKLAYAVPLVSPSLVALSQAGDLARYRSNRALLITRATDVGDIEPAILMCADAARPSALSIFKEVRDAVILHLWTETLSEFEPSSGSLKLAPRCISLVAGSDVGQSWVKLVTSEPAWEERLY